MADIVERLLTSTDSLGHAAATAIRELRKKLAEAELARDTYRFEMGAAQSILVDREQQLLATQAHAARMKEALETCKARTITGSGPMCEVSFYFDGAKVQKALSTPINLDALHEDRARTLEKAAKAGREATGVSMYRFLMDEAAANRAKKEGK